MSNMRKIGLDPEKFITRSMISNPHQKVNTQPPVDVVDRSDRWKWERSADPRGYARRIPGPDEAGE